MYLHGLFSIFLMGACMFASTSFGQSNISPTPAQIAQSNSASGPLISGSSPISPGSLDNTTAEFLRFSEHVRAEASRERESLTRLYDATQRLLDTAKWVGSGLIAVAATLLTVFDIRSRRALKDLAKGQIQKTVNDTRKRAEEEINSLRDKYFKQLEDRVNERASVFQNLLDDRQRKYSKLLRNFFAKLIKNADGRTREEFLGVPESCVKLLSGKYLIWVDDDVVGLALLLELGQFYGLHIHCCESSFQALNLLKTNPPCDVLLTNLNREREGRDAGLKLAESLRNDGFDLPIIIFTRPEHRDHFSARFAACKVSDVVVNERELFTALIKNVANE